MPDTSADLVAGFKTLDWDARVRTIGRLVINGVTLPEGMLQELCAAHREVESDELARLLIDKAARSSRCVSKRPQRRKRSA